MSDAGGAPRGTARRAPPSPHGDARAAPASDPTAPRSLPSGIAPAICSRSCARTRSAGTTPSPSPRSPQPPSQNACAYPPHGPPVFPSARSSPPDSRPVTHVAGLQCYLCTRSGPPQPSPPVGERGYFFFLPQRVVHQIGGEIGRAQLHVAAVAVAGESARDDDVVLDMVGDDPEHSGGALELRVEVRVDHLFLPGEPFVRFGLAQPVDLLLAHDLPIGFAGPAGGGQRLRVIVRDAQFVEVLAEPDIGGPAGELGAACDIKYRHPILAFPARE